jgi:hypothetical protein
MTDVNTNGHRGAWWRLAGLLLCAPVLMGFSCFGERVFEDGPNHAPNTIFLDGDPYSTPAPDTLITDPAVTLYFNGVDPADGDAMRYYYFRVSPPDTGWAQISGSVRHVTLSDMLDTTYTFCVYAEDMRGGVDPDPTCRTFHVNVFHLGEINVLDWVSERTGELVFNWEMVGSEEPPDAFDWEMQLVQYDIEDTGLRTPLVTGPRVAVDGNELRLVPDPTRRYCLSVFAKDHEGREPAPRRLCYP